MLQKAQEMTDAMSTFLLAIAAVSLIVGSVGVANTMFTSVLEKTKEIGIMKAIGARNNDILYIFLFNSILIGLVGGIIGIIIGVTLSYFLPSVLGNTPLKDTPIIISLNSILIGLFVSIVVGMIAGIVPAYKASKLKPVDALRYE
jgi:putative ABC transport system permease protein